MSSADSQVAGSVPVQNSLRAVVRCSGICSLHPRTVLLKTAIIFPRNHWDFSARSTTLHGWSIICFNDARHPTHGSLQIPSRSHRPTCLLYTRAPALDENYQHKCEENAGNYSNNRRAIHYCSPFLKCERTRQQDKDYLRLALKQAAAPPATLRACDGAGSGQPARSQTVRRRPLE